MDIRKISVICILFLTGIAASAQNQIIRKPNDAKTRTQPVQTQPAPSKPASGTAPAKPAPSPSKTMGMVKSGSVNGHDFVDLGLSVKWATCNVGSSTPSGYGNYYSWGEIVNKSDYSEENNTTYGSTLNDIAGIAEYDVATAEWGDTWRMPTEAEFSELMDNCKNEWVTMHGKRGRKFTGPNGNWIFLPAAGYRLGTELFFDVSDGYYWTSTPLESNTWSASYYFFDSEEYGQDWNTRRYGQSVRPVTE